MLYGNLFLSADSLLTVRFFSPRSARRGGQRPHPMQLPDLIWNRKTDSFSSLNSAYFFISSQITELELYFELAEWNTKRTAVQNIIKHQNLKTTKNSAPETSGALSF